MRTIRQQNLTPRRFPCCPKINSLFRIEPDGDAVARIDPLAITMSLNRDATQPISSIRLINHLQTPGFILNPVVGQECVRPV